MSKKVIGILAAFFISVSMLYGCASRSKTANGALNGSVTAATTSAAYSPGKSDVEYSSQMNDKYGATAAATTAETRAGAYAGGSAGADEGAQAAFTVSDALSGASNISNPILDERKVIRSANVTLEVEDFDTAYGKINSALLGIGFIQDTNINTDRVYVDGVQKAVKRGYIVIRVDRNKFDQVLNGMKEIGAVLEWSIKGDDVTDKFFDTESRLKLLRLEEERLLNYLEKIQDPDKIIAYESRLTEVRHQIESLTGTLRKISDLVDLSTITVNMNEKYPGSEKSVRERTYWDRLGEKFMNNMRGVLEFCGDFVIFIISALPVLVLLGLIIWIIVALYRRIWRSIRRKNPGVEHFAKQAGDMEKTQEKPVDRG